MLNSVVLTEKNPQSTVPANVDAGFYVAIYVLFGAIPAHLVDFICPWRGRQHVAALRAPVAPKQKEGVVRRQCRQIAPLAAVLAAAEAVVVSAGRRRDAAAGYGRLRLR